MQLFLNTYGTYLHVKDDMFEVRIPKEKETEKHHFSAKKISSILLATSAALSTDAIRLAIENNVDLVFTHREGHPFARVWHSKLGSTTKIRKTQLQASMDERGVEAIKRDFRRAIV